LNCHIIKADLLHHKREILSFWEKSSPWDVGLEEKYAWMYEHNPAGAAHIWLAIDNHSEVVIGMIALFPRKFRVDGNLFIGGIMGDLLVDKQYRNAEAAILLHKAVVTAVEEGVIDFVYGFPNQTAESILKRVSYRLLGMQTRLVLVLKVVPYLLVKYREWNENDGTLENVLKVLPSFFPLKSAGIYWWRKKKQQGSRFQTREVADFDQRFDLFWETAGIPKGFMGERTCEFLRFRFKNTPERAYKILALFYKEQVKGYIVYCNVARSIEICDFLFNGDPTGTDFLIQSLLQSAQRSNAMSITLALLGDRMIETPFKGFGFVERPNRCPAYLYAAERMVSRFPFIIKPTEWLLLQSDNDL